MLHVHAHTPGPCVDGSVYTHTYIHICYMCMHIRQDRVWTDPSPDTTTHPHAHPTRTSPWCRSARTRRFCFCACCRRRARAGSESPGAVRRHPARESLGVLCSMHSRRVIVHGHLRRLCMSSMHSGRVSGELCSVHSRRTRAPAVTLWRQIWPWNCCCLTIGTPRALICSWAACELLCDVCMHAHMHSYAFIYV